jgi:hypothetical protein
MRWKLAYALAPAEAEGITVAKSTPIFELVVAVLLPTFNHGAHASHFFACPGFSPATASGASLV